MLDYGKDGNKYRNTKPYPRKEDYKIYYIYKKGNCLAKVGYDSGDDDILEKLLKDNKISDPSTSNQMRKLADCGYAIDNEIHSDFERDKKEYDSETVKLNEQWYNDLYAYYGVNAKNPIIMKIMSKAWEDGHHAGFSEVEHHFDELLSFAIDIITAETGNHPNFSKW